MRLIDYLQQHSGEADAWTGGETTLRMLGAFVQGISSVASFGGAAKDALLNCHRFLQDLGVKTADRELRADVDTCAALIATALKTTYNVQVDVRRTPGKGAGGSVTASSMRLRRGCKLSGR